MLGHVLIFGRRMCGDGRRRQTDGRGVRTDNKEEGKIDGSMKAKRVCLTLPPFRTRVGKIAYTERLLYGQGKNEREVIYVKTTEAFVRQGLITSPFKTIYIHKEDICGIDVGVFGGQDYADKKISLRGREGERL